MSRRSLAALALGLAAAALVAFAPARVQEKPKAPPATWLVLLDVGKKLDPAKPILQDPSFGEHVAYVKKLSSDGSLLLGGPLFDDSSERKITGALWIVQAENADAARKLVAADSLVSHELMSIASVRSFLPGAGAWIPTDKPAGGH